MADLRQIQRAFWGMFNAPGRAVDRMDAHAQRVANPPLGTAGFCRCGERFEDDVDRARGQCPECYSKHW